MRYNNGQSLVEMAILLPLLIFIFIGLVEIGYMMRDQLVLVQATREAARFAVRGDVLDFGQSDPGYGRVISHFLDVTGPRLPRMDLTQAPNAYLLITHLYIDTGYPCDPLAGCPPQACDQIPAWNFYWQDDAVLTPSLVPTYTIGYGKVQPSRIDWSAYVSDRIEENNLLNCQAMKRADGIASPFIPSTNSIIIVEAFYDHRQLLGMPVISNRFTDPINLYTWTAIRRSEASE